MRSTVFSSGGIKLDTETADQGKKQVVAVESQTVPKKGSSEPPVRVPGILSTIHNLHSKARTFSSSRSAVGRPGQSPTVIKGQEENWVNLGPLTLPLAKQMGAEGTPVKSKSLFGQASHNHMGKMDPVASNGSKQPRKAGPKGGIPVAGVPSPEHGPDGKRRNLLKAVGLAATQTGCIRQILLLQLELIEQQQQQLQNKNKEIDNLKAEKDMLMARIERMERRLQMESRPRQTPRRREAVERVSSEGTGCSEGQSHPSRQVPIGRSGKSLKRRFLFQESRMARSRRPQSKTPPPKESQAFKEEESEDEEEEEEEELEHENQEEEEEEEEEEENETSMSPEIQTHDLPLVKSEELPYLATTEMYLCCWHQPPPSPWRDPSPEQDDIVPVPSWREIIVDPLEYETATNVTENVDDSVFLKRHTKLELDEKRRKRWDIQRIREQRIYQRLQQRTNRNKVVQEPEPELLSFYPEAEEVESIVITPFLPVVAFGRPLPHIQQQNFDLPWLDEHNCYRQEVSKKKTPHRTCRK